MELRAILMLVSLFDVTFTEEYTDWTTLFWMKAGEAGDPYQLWQGPGAYDSATNKTVWELLSASSVGYRNTFLDTWTSQSAPDKIRVSYRNSDGMFLRWRNFVTTGTTFGDWATGESQFRLNKSLQSYESSFAILDESLSTVRYEAVSLSNSTVSLLVAAGDNPIMFPLPAATAVTGACYASNGAVSLNLLHGSVDVTNLTHATCAAICLELAYPYGAINIVTCSCLDAAPAGPNMITCTTPCEGDPTEWCGGYDPTYTAITVMETGVDLSDVNGLLTTSDTLVVDGTLETSYPSTFYLFGYDVKTSLANLPVTINLSLTYRDEPCSGNVLTNWTTTHAVPLTVASPVYELRFEPLPVQCVFLKMTDSSSNSLLTFPVNVTTISLSGDKFLSATYLSVEASWIIVNTTGLCECECWVHELLYGQSPFDNLTYEEIEKQLENITSAIVRELSVNRSSLSATIRTKTSADDSRQSAAVVGYALGVTILTVTLCGLFLADLPKLLGNFHMLLDNLRSRFSSPEPPTTNTVEVYR